jgi:hypothetical protein
MDKHDRPYRQSSEDDVMDYLATGDDTGTRNDMGDLCDVTENVSTVQALLNRWLDSSASALLLKDDGPVT